jgi:hypothetical protein
MLLLSSISLQSAVHWLSLDIRKWECPNADLTMIKTSMQLKTLEMRVYEL